MSKAPYLPLFVKEYLADTTHLSAEESGAYLHILMVMWFKGGSLDASAGDVQRISRVAPQRWRRVWQAIEPFFTRNEAGQLTQKRLSEEWNYVSDIRVKKKAAAEARWSKNNNLPNAPAMQVERPHTHTHKDITESENLTKSKPPRSARDEPLEVLDAEYAEAVIEHRKRIRKPLNAYAAKLLAEEAGERSRHHGCQRGRRHDDRPWLAGLRAQVRREARPTTHAGQARALS